MSETRPMGVLCLASYEKGMEFLRECKRQGCYVMLMTNERRAEGAWPRESIDELFVMPDLWKREDMIHTVSYLARSHMLDQIIDRPLDEGDLLSNANTVIYMGKVRDGLKMRRALYIAKHRSSAASDNIHPYTIDDSGLTVAAGE